MSDNLPPPGSFKRFSAAHPGLESKEVIARYNEWLGKLQGVLAEGLGTDPEALHIQGPERLAVAPQEPTLEEAV